jgi:hypothetical protein
MVGLGKEGTDVESARIVRPWQLWCVVVVVDDQPLVITSATEPPLDCLRRLIKIAAFSSGLELN